MAQILVGFPIKEYQLIGQYYLAWCGYRENKDVRSELEVVIEQSKTHRAKALLSLAAVESGSYGLELKLYKEAAKWGNSSIVAQAARGIAIVKAREGSHRHAVSDLETITVLTWTTDPIAYFQYLNSFAVELGEVGRIEEAQNVCRITLASPFAFAYPEWRETWQELALRGYKSRSVVSVPKLPLKSNNVVPIPVNTNPSLPQKGGGKVLDLQAWIEKMVKENGDDDKIKNVDNMSEQDMVLELIGMLTNGEADEKQIRKLLKTALKIFSEK